MSISKGSLVSSIPGRIQEIWVLNPETKYQKNKNLLHTKLYKVSDTYSFDGHLHKIWSPADDIHFVLELLPLFQTPVSFLSLRA